MGMFEPWMTLVVVNDDYTARPGDLVVCDLSNKSVVITMPAVENDVPIGVKLGTASGSRTATVNRAGSDTIDGATSVVLYVSKDYIEFFGNATNSRWEIVRDDRKPHIARMRNTLAQLLLTATNTPLEFNTTDIDNASLCDLSAESFTIRRSSYYDFHAFATGVNLDLAERLQLSLVIGGTREVESFFYSPVTDAAVPNHLHWAGNLSAGNVLTVNVFQNEGNNQSLSISTGFATFASLHEVR